MTWLRRVPAETRIVVLVVFLALFQAILLSIFGLKAIQGERRQVAQRISLDAEHFLERSVAGLLVQRLGHFANEALDAAFVDGNPERLRRDPATVGGLFTDAYLVTANGEIREPGPDAYPVLRSRESVRAEKAAVIAKAAAFRDRYRVLEMDESSFPAKAVAFARAHPFALDESLSSLSLPFAATPLFAGESTPSRDLLAEAHWIGLLVAEFGFAPPRQAAAFLEAIREKLGTDPIAATQRARIDSLRALAEERSLFDPARRAAIHDNVRADARHVF